MTIGIYRLCFSGTDQCYIGQSINIEQRFKQHLLSFKNSTAANKLLNAYNTYGPPILEVLTECTIDELDNLELQAIEIFDSYNNGFNSTRLTYPVLKGEDHGNSKYSNKQIIDAAILLSNIKNTTEYVSEKTGISISAVRSIACLQNHSWLADVIPDVVLKLKEILGNRNSAESKHCIHPAIVSPAGIVYENIKHFANFCNEHNLDASHFTNLLNGKLKSHKGWTLLSNPIVDQNEDPRCGKNKGKTYPPVKSPEGIEYTEIPNAAKFCKEHSLNKSAFSQLLQGKVKTHKGWRLVNHG